MPTYDEFGNVVSDAPQAQPGAPVGAESNFGAALWAFFHPLQVQQEYAAVGKPVPPVQDIMASASDDMQTYVAGGVKDMINTGKWVALGIGVLAVVYVVRELTKGR